MRQEISRWIIGGPMATATLAMVMVSIGNRLTMVQVAELPYMKMV